jgi:hypothetical protein
MVGGVAFLLKKISARTWKTRVFHVLLPEVYTALPEAYTTKTK